MRNSMRLQFISKLDSKSVVIVLLLVLNVILLWRDYRNEQESVIIQTQLIDARFKMRVLESEVEVLPPE